MAKHDNLSDFLTDIADAIREKTGKTGHINAQTFSDEIRALNVQTGSGSGSIPERPEVTRPTWTGHADVEGLRAIGWTDEDIAYYQEHGVNWNEEDDHLHLVSDDNKALYGVLNANNISTYKDRIVYLPKIDTSNVTIMTNMFYNCYSLTKVNLKNVKLAYQLNNSTLLSKESLLYLINNSIATSAITIKLATYAYTRLAEDADIVAALANHPNISIAQ